MRANGSSEGKVGRINESSRSMGGRRASLYKPRIARNCHGLSAGLCLYHIKLEQLNAPRAGRQRRLEGEAQLGRPITYVGQYWRMAKNNRPGTALELGQQQPEQGLGVVAGHDFGIEQAQQQHITLGNRLWLVLGRAVVKPHSGVAGPGLFDHAQRAIGTDATNVGQGLGQGRDERPG